MAVELKHNAYYWVRDGENDAAGCVVARCFVAAGGVEWATIGEDDYWPGSSFIAVQEIEQPRLL